MSGKIKYPIGTRFNNWTLIERLPSKKGYTPWLVRCNCGFERVTGASNITTGASRMCAECSMTMRYGK